MINKELNKKLKDLKITIILSIIFSTIAAFVIIIAIILLEINVFNSLQYLNDLDINNHNSQPIYNYHIPYVSIAFFIIGVIVVICNIITSIINAVRASSINNKINSNTGIETVFVLCMISIFFTGVISAILSGISLNKVNKIITFIKVSDVDGVPPINQVTPLP